MTHPGNVPFGDLPEYEQRHIADGWGGVPLKKAGVMFDVMTPRDRWEVRSTLPGRDGSQAAEARRIAAKVDPATNGAFGRLSEARKDKAADEFQRHLTFVRGEDVEIEPPTWLWSRWLVRGALHLLIGRQGMGKSTVAAWLVANVTTGGRLPGDTSPHNPARCAMLSLEEPDSRLAARLRAAGADMSRVIVLREVAERSEKGADFHRPWRMPMDCSLLEEVIVQEGLELVTVDGLGYSVTGDSHNYAVVASALAELVKVAERTGATILGLTHPPKGGSEAVTAAIGSTAWTAVPRITWVLGSDNRSRDDGCPAVSVAKTAYQKPDSAYEFAISNSEDWDCGYVSRMSASDVSADDLTAPASGIGERSERQDAREMLRDLLPGGMPASEVMKATRAAGLSDSTVKRAKADLNVTSLPIKDPDTGRIVGWTLSLPQEATRDVPGPCDPLGPLGVTRENGPSGYPEGQPRLSDPLDEVDPPVTKETRPSAQATSVTSVTHSRSVNPERARQGFVSACTDVLDPELMFGDSGHIDDEEVTQEATW